MEFRIPFLAFIASMILASCSTPKDITYFQDVRDGSDINILMPYHVKVQPGDKLRIIVSTQDDRLSNQFNLKMITNQASSGGTDQL